MFSSVGMLYIAVVCLGAVVSEQSPVHLRVFVCKFFWQEIINRLADYVLFGLTEVDLERLITSLISSLGVFIEDGTRDRVHHKLQEPVLLPERAVSCS